MSGPTFSVIVATRNRRALLEQTLQALAAQDWPRDRIEILIVDNGSTDDTRSVVERASAAFPSIRYSRVETPGKSFAVNEGLAASRGDLIALTDDDVQPEPDWLKQLAASFDETAADFIAGRVRPLWEVPPPAWLSPALYGVIAVPDNGDARIDIGHGGSTAVVPIGANTAVRRDAIRRIGGLRTDLGKLEGSLRTGEDHDLYLRMLRAGLRGVYEPTAVVHHWVPAARLNRSYFLRWYWQNGQDVAQLDRTHPTDVPHVFAVPRYLVRQACTDSWKWMSARGEARRFEALSRLVWFAGFLKSAWYSRSASGSIPAAIQSEPLSLKANQ
jgi:glucosyl-dolichyl phosphate glucuronosyltransferase